MRPAHLEAGAHTLRPAIGRLCVMIRKILRNTLGRATLAEETVAGQGKDAEVSRSLAGCALRATPSRYILLRSIEPLPGTATEKLRPIIFPDVRVHDMWIPCDFITSHPALSAAYFVVLYTCLIVMGLLALSSPLYAPIAVMRFTNVTWLLMADEAMELAGARVNILKTDRFNGTLESLVRYALAPPWGAAYDETCLVAWDVFVGASSYAWLNSLVLMPNGTALKHLWGCSKSRRIMLHVLLSNLAYTFCASVMLPSVHHVSYLLMRHLVFSAIVHFDAHMVTLKLRHRRKDFAKLWGRNGKKGPISLLYVLGGCILVLIDLFRHYAMQYATDEVLLIHFGRVKNPITGQRMGYTNHQVTELLYFFSVAFAMRLFWDTWKTNFGQETLVLKPCSGLLFPDEADGRTTWLERQPLPVREKMIRECHAQMEHICQGANRAQAGVKQVMLEVAQGTRTRSRDQRRALADRSSLGSQQLPLPELSCPQQLPPPLPWCQSVVDDTRHGVPDWVMSGVSSRDSCDGRCTIPARCSYLSCYQPSDPLRLFSAPSKFRASLFQDEDRAQLSQGTSASLHSRVGPSPMRQSRELPMVPHCSRMMSKQRSCFEELDPGRLHGVLERPNSDRKRRRGRAVGWTKEECIAMPELSCPQQLPRRHIVAV